MPASMACAMMTSVRSAGEHLDYVVFVTPPSPFGVVVYHAVFSGSGLDTHKHAYSEQPTPVSFLVPLPPSHNKTRDSD